MYLASVPVFQRQLGALSNVLAKGEAHAAARKIDPSVLIQMRIFPDMFPLSKQVQIATDAAKGAVARLAGVEPPTFEDTEATFDQLKDRCARTIAFIGGFRPDQIDGTEEKEIVLPMRSTTLTLKGQAFLLGLSMPNFYFHVTTTYNILRHCGVELSKRDFLNMS